MEEFGDGSGPTRAQVRLSGGEDGKDGKSGSTSGSMGMLAYDRPDGTSSFVTVTRLTRVLDGWAGSFVLRGEGPFDGTTASGASHLWWRVPRDPRAGRDSAALVSSVSTHHDYPFMPLTLAYDLA